MCFSFYFLSHYLLIIVLHQHTSAQFRFKRQVLPSENIQVYSYNSSVFINESVVVLSGDSHIDLKERFMCGQIWSAKSRIEFIPSGQSENISAAIAVNATFGCRGVALHTSSNKLSVFLKANRTGDGHSLIELYAQENATLHLNSLQTQIEAIDGHSAEIFMQTWNLVLISRLIIYSNISEDLSRYLTIDSISSHHNLRIRLSNSKVRVRYGKLYAELDSDYRTITLASDSYIIELSTNKSAFEVFSTEGEFFIRCLDENAILKTRFNSSKIFMEIAQNSRTEIERNGGRIQISEDLPNYVENITLVAKELFFELNSEPTKSAHAVANNSRIIVSTNETKMSSASSRHVLNVFGAPSKFRIFTGNVAFFVRSNDDLLPLPTIDLPSVMYKSESESHCSDEIDRTFSKTNTLIITSPSPTISPINVKTEPNELQFPSVSTPALITDAITQNWFSTDYSTPSSILGHDQGKSTTSGMTHANDNKRTTVIPNLLVTAVESAGSEDDFDPNIPTFVLSSNPFTDSDYSTTDHGVIMVQASSDPEKTEKINGIKSAGSKHSTLSDMENRSLKQTGSIKTTFRTFPSTQSKHSQMDRTTKAVINWTLEKPSDDTFIIGQYNNHDLSGNRTEENNTTDSRLSGDDVPYYDYDIIERRDRWNEEPYMRTRFANRPQRISYLNRIKESQNERMNPDYPLYENYDYSYPDFLNDKIFKMRIHMPPEHIRNKHFKRDVSSSINEMIRTALLVEGTEMSNTDINKLIKVISLEQIDDGLIVEFSLKNNEFVNNTTQILNKIFPKIFTTSPDRRSVRPEKFYDAKFNRSFITIIILIISCALIILLFMIYFIRNVTCTKQVLPYTPNVRGRTGVFFQ